VSTTCPFVWLGLMKEILVKQSWQTQIWFDKLWTKNYETLVEVLNNTLHPLMGLKIMKERQGLIVNWKTFTYLRCYFQNCTMKVVYLFERKMMWIACHFERGGDLTCLLKGWRPHLNFTCHFEHGDNPCVSLKDGRPNFDLMCHLKGDDNPILNQICHLKGRDNPTCLLKDRWPIWT